METTITLPVSPGDDAYVVWNNLIQKGKVTEVNSKVTKPATTIVIATEFKVEIAGPTIVRKLAAEVFPTIQAAADWLEDNPNPPVAP